MAKAVEYRIEYSENAAAHLDEMTKRQRVVVIEAIDAQLMFEPAVETRHRKRLRANPLAPWELRVGDLRVFYDVADQPEPMVQVLAVGVKIRSRVVIGGVEVDL